MNLHLSLVVVFACAAGLQTSNAEPAKPVDRSLRKQVGVGSFYGREEAGKSTASGTPMKPDSLTAASRTLPLGAQAKVLNKDTGKSVVVTVNDRGPYAQDRVVDVTPKAADALGMTKRGVANVEVQPLHEPAPSPKPSPSSTRRH